MTVVHQDSDRRSPTSQRSFDMIKIVLVGDTGVGKSCLLLRFVDDAFADSYTSTIGVDFRFRVLDQPGDDKKSVRLQIWDTAGQERFRTITSAYYRGADGIVITYDCTTRTSFNNVESWVQEVDNMTSVSGGTTKILVACKSDAVNRVVSNEEGQAKAEKLGLLFAETSAKAPFNVETPFRLLSAEVLKRLEASGGRNGGRRVDLNSANTNAGAPVSQNKENLCC